MTKKLAYFLILYSCSFFSQEKEIVSNNYFPEMNDFIVTKNLDTLTKNIRIKDDYNSFKFYNKKKKISKKKIKNFRKNGFEYYYKKKRRATIQDKKYGFLKLIQKGEVFLYEYEFSGHYGPNTIGSSSVYYFIERDEKLSLIVPTRFYLMIKRILPENKKLLEMLKEKKLRFEDIYIVIKYFNENFKI